MTSFKIFLPIAALMGINGGYGNERTIPCLPKRKHKKNRQRAKNKQKEIDQKKQRELKL